MLLPPALLAGFGHVEMPAMEGRGGAQFWQESARGQSSVSVFIEFSFLVRVSSSERRSGIIVVAATRYDFGDITLSRGI